MFAGNCGACDTRPSTKDRRKWRIQKPDINRVAEEL